MKNNWTFNTHLIPCFYVLCVPVRLDKLYRHHWLISKVNIYMGLFSSIVLASEVWPDKKEDLCWK